MQTTAENSTWAQRIRALAQRRALPHALILSGPGDREAAAHFVAAAMECSAAEDRPCGVCEQCRKVREDIHPDVLWVRDTEHKELQVEAIRALRREIYIRPNDGERKVVIFPDCGQLNERDQNVLLKIVEEGPPYAAFLFCTEVADRLLSTIRSRCVELKLPRQGAEAEPDLTLCRIFSTGRLLPVVETLVDLENRKIKREQLQSLLRDTWHTSAEAMLLQRGKPVAPGALGEGSALLAKTLTPRQLHRLTAILEHYTTECNYNVGVGHVLGAIAAEWEKTL